MSNLNVEEILMLLCGIVVLSYIFSIASHYTRIPSVLLLLLAGIGLKMLADYYHFQITIPTLLIESLGLVALIMIILEAGLDLELGHDKKKMIRDSFLSALILFICSSALLTTILYYWLDEPIKKCLVYAIPLSIMSASIVIPSITPLIHRKKEFLIYEASFSDILGILVFNYFIVGEPLSIKAFGMLSVNIGLGIILSVIFSLLLFFILAKVNLTIKFFLIFSLLILIYSGGKLLHLPSLIIILTFGLIINNWEKIRIPSLMKLFPLEKVEPLRHLLHSITAETSFLIRTFFFILFGYSISITFLTQKEVLLIGSAIVLGMFLLRLIYLRFFLHTNVFPESFFIPRGLITIVLFYKIPDHLKLKDFNEGILFFVILTTSVVMTLGMLFYKKRPEEVIVEGQFHERRDIF